MHHDSNWAFNTLWLFLACKKAFVTPFQHTGQFGFKQRRFFLTTFPRYGGQQYSTGLNCVTLIKPFRISPCTRCTFLKPDWSCAFSFPGTLTILMDYKTLGICILPNTELLNLRLSWSFCMHWKCVLLSFLSASKSASATGSPSRQRFPKGPPLVGLKNQVSTNKLHYFLFILSSSTDAFMAWIIPVLLCLSVICIWRMPNSSMDQSTMA